MRERGRGRRGLFTSNAIYCPISGNRDKQKRLFCLFGISSRIVTQAKDHFFRKLGVDERTSHWRKKRIKKGLRSTCVAKATSQLGLGILNGGVTKNERRLLRHSLSRNNTRELLRTAHAKIALNTPDDARWLNRKGIISPRLNTVATSLLHVASDSQTETDTPCPPSKICQKIAFFRGLIC